MFNSLGKYDKSSMATGPRKKNLKGVLDLIKQEGELTNPRHQRRMRVLREKTVI